MDIGDKVRHRTDNNYNALQMEVKEVGEGKILCDYFDYKENVSKEKWFDESELELVTKAEGGFFN